MQGIEQGTACACTLLSVLSGVLISLWAQDLFREVSGDPRAVADGQQPHTVVQCRREQRV